jgi:hypothetical protein
VALYAMYHQKIAECDRQLKAHLETFAECQDRETLPPVSRPRKRTRNRLQLDGRGALHRITGVA